MALSVMFAESLNPDDFYKGRTDANASHGVLGVQESDSCYRIVLTKKMLKHAVKEAARKQLTVLHISAHGDRNGIQLSDGMDVDWPELAKMLAPFASLRTTVVISACDGGHVRFTKALEKNDVRFGCVFGPLGEPGFVESCLAWSVLYFDLDGKKLNRQNVTTALEKVNHAASATFVCRRWSRKKEAYISIAKT